MDDQNLHGFYLFGLAPTTSAPISNEHKQRLRKDNAKVISTLTTTLRTFESDIQQNSRYYDPLDAFVSVTNISSSQLPSSVVLDNHSWSDNCFDDVSDDSDDDGAEVEVPFTSASLSAPKKKQVKSKATGHIPASKL
jgi:hypothetical protein